MEGEDWSRGGHGLGALDRGKGGDGRVVIDGDMANWWQDLKDLYGVVAKGEKEKFRWKERGAEGSDLVCAKDIVDEETDL